MTRIILEDFDFNINEINCIYYNEPNGRLFLGSQSKGLFVMTKKSFETITSGKENIGSIFYAQAPFGNGVLTPIGDVFSRDNKTGKGTFETLSLIKNKNNTDHYSVITDKRGDIWTKFRSQLLKYNASGNKLLGEWSFKNNGITQLYEGLDGMIWIGTFDTGLWQIDSRKSSVADWKPRRIKSFPGSADINYTIQESKTVLWIGTSNGLYTLNPENRQLKQLPGTGKMNIRSIFLNKGSGSEVWFTTFEDGFFLLKNSKLIHFPLDDKKYLSFSHCIVSDDNGFFWIPTNHGLFQILKSDLLAYAKQPFDLYYQYYDKSQGFLTNEFNGGCQPCAIRLPNRTVSLPSLEGLVWFTPEKIIAETPIQKMIADRFGVQGVIKNVEGDTISLPLSPEQVTVYFTTPYFGNRANLNISYALVKKNSLLVEANWLAVRNGEEMINLGNIGSGKYKLYINKKNGFGVNNNTITFLTIIVPEHWYETSLFNLLSMFLLIIFVYIYIRLRTNYLNRQNQQLETAIKFRTSELERMLAALQNSEKQLSRQMHIYSRLVASVSHDVNTPLKIIKYMLGRLSAVMVKKDYVAACEITKSIDDGMNDVVKLVDNLTNYIKTQLYESEPAIETVHLKELVDEKIRLFDSALKQNRNHIHNEVPPMLTVNSQTHLLSILVHNLLDNANKHCRRSMIRIFSKVENNQIHLVIADSGPGMPENLVAWLNAPAESISIEELRELSQEHQGLGLIIVQEMCLQLQIRLFIEVKNGTAIHLIFPE